MKRKIAALAVAAAAFSCSGATASPSQASAAAQAPSPVQRTVLSRTDVPGSNYEVVLMQIEIVPDGHVPAHTHPGTVMAYLLEGDWSVSIAGAPYRKPAPGAGITIPAGAVHEEQVGPKGAKAIAVFTVEKGKPLTTPVAP